MVKRENIEAIYPLDGKRKALAYLSMQGPETDPGFIQLRFTITGPLNKSAFERSWNLLLERHQSMRMSLQGPKGKDAMLVALKKCQLKIEWRDWRELSEDASNKLIDGYIEENQLEGLNLSDAPVHRCVGIETKDDEIVFLWSCHHLFLDGWSAIVLLKDLSQLYASLRVFSEPDAAERYHYGDYLSWLNNQPKNQGMEYWSRNLQDFSTTSLITESLNQEALSNQRSEYIYFESESSSRLIEATALKYKTTSANLIYAIWSVYLSGITGKKDVLFGTTAAGRTFDLADNEIMTGYYSNVIPKRFVLAESSSMENYLSIENSNSFSSLPFEYMALEEIRSCSGVPPEKKLFDHLVLFENLPQDNIVLNEPDGKVTIGNFSGGLTSAYPLTLTILPGKFWRYKFIYNIASRDEKLEAEFRKFPSLVLDICNNMEKTVSYFVNTVSYTHLTLPTILLV